MFVLQNVSTIVIRSQNRVYLLPEGQASGGTLIESALYISALILTLDLEGPLRGCLSFNCELIHQIQLLQWPTYESLIESCV